MTRVRVMESRACTVSKINILVDSTARGLNTTAVICSNLQNFVCMKTGYGL